MLFGIHGLNELGISILYFIPKSKSPWIHRQSMDSIYLFVKFVDFIQSPWSPHVNPWIPCIPWTPQGLPGGLRSTPKYLKWAFNTQASEELNK